MNKWLGLILLGIYPMHSYAIENGTSVAWDSNHNDDIIKLYSADEERNCSGTLIAGKYTLTAAHCVERSDLISKIKTARGQQYQIITNNPHPLYDPEPDNSYPDYALTELEHSVDATHIHFFADLTTDPFVEGAPLKVFGFGGTEEKLNYADFTMTELVGGDIARLDGKMVNDSHTRGGDSGGAWLDSNNRIVATHKGGGTPYTDGHRETHSTNLHYSYDFILETINGWHYPTLAYTSNGKATITVQSLHADTYGSVDDMAYIMNGNAQIVGGTCYNATDIQPFSTCTYYIESQGGESSLFLGTDKNGNDEIITINKVAPQPDNGSGDSDGGSLGGLGLLLLSGFGLLRRKKTYG